MFGTIVWQRYRRLFRYMAMKIKQIRYLESTDTPNIRKGLNFQFHRCFEEGETYIVSAFLPFLAGRKTNQESAGPATEPPLQLPNTKRNGTIKKSWKRIPSPITYQQFCAKPLKVPTHLSLKHRYNSSTFL